MKSPGVAPVGGAFSLSVSMPGAPIVTTPLLPHDVTSMALTRVLRNVPGVRDAVVTEASSTAASGRTWFANMTALDGASVPTLMVEKNELTGNDADAAVTATEVPAAHPAKQTISIVGSALTAVAEVQRLKCSATAGTLHCNSVITPPPT